MRLRASSLSWQLPGRHGGRMIIDGVDLDVAPGSFTGLLGPNGSGKSSLLSVVSGLRRPTRGTVRLGDDDLHRLRPRERARRIALVEQHAATGLELTVRQVVELGRVPHAGRGIDNAGIVAEAMKLARVGELADRSWQTLSGGERQRTHLARALAQQPQVLLLDEPTNHLDLGHQLDFLACVRGLGITTIAALHDLDLAAAYCDRLVVLQAGRIVADGDVAAVLTPELLADVYGVRATVQAHPHTGRPQICWHPGGVDD
ncbi:ABC transporter ATP-binding protein [Nocardioides limicola]|uniref:ABC transporter ATP-binding protein n=1 Tax=Nocardioides limicola TaxID=2803368 RepID=UPI00193AEA75|nr:ATP-binding cassette domain-containing protein [Nocardioides sp. DJM-14]